MSWNSELPALVNVSYPFCLSTASQNTSENCLEAVSWLWVFVPYMACYAKPVPPHVFNPVPCEEYGLKDCKQRPSKKIKPLCSNVILVCHSAHKGETCVPFNGTCVQQTSSFSLHVLKLLFYLAQLIYFKEAFPLSRPIQVLKKIVLLLQIEHGSLSYLYSTMPFYNTGYQF